LLSPKTVELVRIDSRGGLQNFKFVEMGGRSGRDVACLVGDTDSQNLESREISARREQQGSVVPPFLNEAGTRLNVLFSSVLLFGHAALFTNTTHSNYFQFYNNAILGIGKIFF
jgi:hypothetical protein